MRPDDIFTALADDTRRVIVDVLADRGPSTATELAADLPITRQAVAKHLTHLRRADLVASERLGRETRYRLTTDRLSEAIAWLNHICTRAEPAGSRADR